MSRSFKLIGREEARELRTHGFSPVKVNESGSQEDTTQVGEERKRRRMNKKARRVARLNRERQDILSHIGIPEID